MWGWWGGQTVQGMPCNQPMTCLVAKPVTACDEGRPGPSHTVAVQLLGELQGSNLAGMLLFLRRQAQPSLRCRDRAYSACHSSSVGLCSSGGLPADAGWQLTC